MEKRDNVRDEIIEAARRHVGYRALPLRDSIFGISNRDWNGAFIRYVFDECGQTLPTDSTVELLSRLLQENRLYSRPKNGDLVFYAFPAEDSTHGQPHVGIVTDASRWKDNRSFLAVEGQTASPHPKTEKTPNGVFERRRYHTDVLTFARPFFRVPTQTLRDGGREIALSQVQSGKRHKAVESVQVALGATVGLRDATRGLYDSRTRSAMAAFQRRLGRTGTDASGLPDLETLTELATQTGEFQIRS